MNWFIQLLTEHSIAQTVIVYGLVIAIGVTLGKIKIWGVSLGIAWVLFAGILASHFHIIVDKTTEHFLRDFGLILFVYAIGLQVGPGFFASLKKQALSVNLLAATVVLLGVSIAVLFYFLTNNNIGVITGVLSGAVTNTPGLGAAQQAIVDLNLAAKGINPAQIGLAYAIAYPFGVIGIILVLLILKKVFRVDLKKEQEKHVETLKQNVNQPIAVNLEVSNNLLYNKPLQSIYSLIKEPFVVSRMYHNQEIMPPNPDTLLAEGDVLLVVATQPVIHQLKMIVGDESTMKLQEQQGVLISRRIVVTRKNVTYKNMSELEVLNRSDCNITRINRAGIEFIASANTMLHLGDQVTVVGTESGIKEMANALGNSLKRLEVPDLGPVFTGIVLGVVFGSIPIAIPGVPVAVKLGLAGGPLIVALFLSQFGNKFYLNNYTTHSANLMLREIGIVLFLASVGLSSGEHFVDILNSGQGWYWMAMGAAITVIPLLIVGFIARYAFRKNFFEICGLLSGASTDPPALAFAIQMAGNDTPSVTYATVYPLTMILRILAAQALILVFG